MSAVDSRFFAPGARLVGADGTTVLQTTVDDLVSVSVTLVNTGVSQCSVRLNNQRHDPEHKKPLYPPWKYNDLKDFKFGQRFAVQVAYAARGSQIPWKTLIFCRVTDIGFTFPAGGGAQMTLEGQDLLSLLNRSASEDKRYTDADELDIVKDVLTRSQCKLSLADPLVTRATFSETLHQAMHQKRTPFLGFLQPLADRLDYEIFVDNQVKKAEDVKLHFEPARSLKSVTGAAVARATDVVDLEWGKNLIEFSPKLRVADQYTKVTVKGAHPRRRDQVVGEIGPEEIDRDLRWDANPRPLNARDVFTRYMTEKGDPAVNEPIIEVQGLDVDRARLKAAAELRKRARELVTAQASTIGAPELVPGIHVNLKGIRPPFSGLYYCTKAVHTLDSGGYKTQVSLRRPGMADPSLYLSDQVSS